MCVDSHNNITTEQLYARFLKVDSIVTDSRLVLSEVAKGKKVMFFCLKGDSFDANDFIDEVLESGAAYIVSDREGVVGSEKILKTANTLTALQSMANHHRRGMRAQVIALTGSNGKTTTKELMNVVLSKKYNVLSTKGNLNNHIGVPLTLLSLTDKHDIAIIEQGANHKGEIAALCAISEPDYGLITNIGKAHLEGFGGEEGIIEGKGEMFDFLLNNGSVAFYNSSLPHLSDMIAKRVGLRSVAYNSSLITTNHLSSIDGISFIYKDQNVTTHLTGEYNLYNVLTAIAVGCYFDVEDADIISAITAPEKGGTYWL
ncbi:MAG: UDP-N-acetylmuramoyl-tripeptide--D-alanyl-D-alanine ligase, partial [Rikenellaceae bacterium]